MRAGALDPALWPAVLLQLGCFLGRSAPFTDPAVAVDAWREADPDDFFDRATRGMFDHGRDRFIISVHVIKTLFAARKLVAQGAGDPRLMASALRRFLSAPIKGRHVRCAQHAKCGVSLRASKLPTRG